MKIFYINILVAFALSSTIFAQTDRERDSLALVDLYNSTNGASWTNNQNWLSTSDTISIDDWHGVTVNGGRVTAIFLYNNNLSGPLPASIGNLNGLTSLYFYSNNLSGSLPAEIGNLSSLRLLNIYGNSLTGSIPVEISNLSQLTGLYLFNNNLTGPIPYQIGNLAQLTALMLSNNSLSGPIPPEIGNLTVLTSMNLSSNQLTGKIPGSFGNLEEMTNLSLNANDLTGMIPLGFGNMTQLTELYLRGNSLSGEIPDTISNLIKLRNFEASYNNLSGSIPAGFSDFTELAKMWINGNLFTGLPDLSHVDSLTTLSIQNNQFTFEDIEPNIGITDFFYSPQDSVGEAMDTSLAIGEKLVLSVDVGGGNNNYQWTKNGVDITGAVEHFFTIDPFKGEDAGAYNCVIGNATAADLTLYSRTINVKELFDEFEKIIDGDIVLDGGDSRGVVWADINNDDFIDLFVANRANQTNFYYKNINGVFEKQTVGDIVTRTNISRGATAADYDNDGDVDLFVANSGNENNELWDNDGSGNFTLQTGEIYNALTNSNGCSWGDIDNDGFLDLYVTNSNSQQNLLYRNNQDGSFTSITDKAPVNDSFESQAVSLVDTDNDGDLDIFVTNGVDGQVNNLYINDGLMEFSDLSAGFGDDKFFARASCWADFDNDGDLDLFVTNHQQPNTLYKNGGNNQFVKLSSGAIVTDVDSSQGCVVEDFDNDGFVDVYVVNLGINSYYKNLGNYNFEKIIEGTLVADKTASLGAACADFNNDGFADIFVSNAAGQNNALYKNKGNDNNWIKIKCEGTASNHSGIGAKVFVKTNSVMQMRQINAQTGYLGQSGLAARFGLGQATEIEMIKIEWPGGVVWDTSAVAVNQLLKIKEPAAVEDDPFIATSPAVNVTDKSAMLKGIVSTKGKSVTKVFFLYGISSSYGDTINAVPYWVSTVDSVSVAANLTSLSVDKTYYYRLVAVTEDDRTIQGGEKSFTTLSGGGSRPTAATGGSNNISARSVEVTGNVNPNNSATTVEFLYSTNTSFTPSNIISAEERTVYGTEEVISRAFITGLEPGTTYYYRITTSNDYGVAVGDVASLTTEVYEQNVTLNHQLSFPDKQIADYTSADFRLLGLPGSSDKYIALVISGEPNTDWIAYWDNGADQDYLVKYDGSNLFYFSNGKAFWVLSKGKIDINMQVDNVAINEKSEASISLHNGWNIITNPFNAQVDWQTVKDAESNNTIAVGDLWDFDGSFRTSNVMDPYKGYYFYIQSSWLNIPYPPRAIGKKAAPIAKKTGGGWDINVILTSAKYVDQSTRLGVSSDAKNDFDKLDSRKPRAFGDIVNIYFDRPQWGVKSASFARDIRPVFDEIEKWDFTVNAIKGVSSNFSFNGINDIPAELSVYLIDKTRSTYQDLRTNETYRYQPVLKTEQFTVAVGKEEFMEGVLAAVLPLEFKVENNFPNPFNPQTTIPVQLPKEADISVEIFNILGEKMTTLFSGKLAAGRHLFNWRAANVPSGIYFYRISSSTNGKALTGKMMLMK